jgi:hypothetical protein
MLTDINPKLPMRNKSATRDFYLNKLGFREFGRADYDGYLMVQRDGVQIHFFEFKDLTHRKTMDRCISVLMILTRCTILLKCKTLTALNWSISHGCK